MIRAYKSCLMVFSTLATSREEQYLPTSSIPENSSRTGMAMASIQVICPKEGAASRSFPV